MSVTALEVMRTAITQPYARGMETLDLTLQPAIADGTIWITAYDFTEYMHTYERLPDSPRYLLIPMFSPVEDLDVTINVAGAGPATVHIPARHFSGSSVAIPISATAQTRLLSIQPLPQSAATTALGAWRVVAVLGNLAKLLWVIGSEYEDLTGVLDRVRVQRDRRQASVASLDRLGDDLGIPRFPAVAHSYDADTIALYHLDDQLQPTQTQAIDGPRPDGGPGHPATTNGALSGRPGRFNTAFEFVDGGSRLTIPDHADFAIAAAVGFTVEAMVRPKSRTDGKAGGVVAKRASLNLPAAPGWALAIGSFRGIDANLRFSISDGAGGVIDIFADRSLGDGIFHHVAGVIERRPTVTVARLYLDGQVVTSGAHVVGPVINAEPVVIGHGMERVTTPTTAVDQDAQYLGIIDEVRLSKVARSSFHPVTGEGEEQYRERLGIFQRWLLPTPKAVVDTINKLVPLPGSNLVDRPSFILQEDTRGIAQATRNVKVLPNGLRRGESIAADGNMRLTVDQAAGTADADIDFDPAWLLRHDDARAVYATDSSRLMQVGMARTLNRLLDLVGPQLSIVDGFVGGSADLRRVGRAVRFSHSTLSPSELAVNAHSAGFDYVMRTVTDEIFAATGPREPFTINAVTGLVQEAGGPPPPPRPDVVLTLTPDPSLRDVEITWSLVHCGAGDGAFIDGERNQFNAWSGHMAIFRGTAAGDIMVRADVTRQRHRTTGTVNLRIPMIAADLALGESIDQSGRRGNSEASASGLLSPYFQPAYLVVRDDDTGSPVPKVQYADALSHRMDRAASAALSRLIGLVPPTLIVTRAYDPTAGDLHAQGRALELSHLDPTLLVPALAVKAFEAGFDYLYRDPAHPQQLHVSVAGGELIGLELLDERDLLVDQVRVGGRIRADIVPQAKPPAAGFSPDGNWVYVADEDTDQVSPLQLTLPPNATLPTAELQAPFPAGHRPVAVWATSHSLYVANAASNTISVIDRTTLQVTATLQPGFTPRAIVGLSDGSKIYVACTGDATVVAYTTATNTKGAPASVGMGPTALAVSPDGQWLYVGDAATGVVHVLREATLQETSRFALPAPGPIGLLAKPDGTRLYVACASDDSVHVYDTSNFAQVGLLGTGAGTHPQAMAITQDQKSLLVACPAAAQVVVLSSDERSTLPKKTIPVGPGVAAIVASPVGTAYAPVMVAVASDDGRITIVDPSAVDTSRSPNLQTVLLSSGLGERVSWTVAPLGGEDAAVHGDAKVTSDVSPHVGLIGVAPGRVLLKAFYVQPNPGELVDPYQFRVRVNPDLLKVPDVNVLIRKDQYDLIMNILANFHPIGVEVRTDELRPHVVELRQASTETFPSYTYPTFRMRRPLLPRN